MSFPTPARVFRAFFALLLLAGVALSACVKRDTLAARDGFDPARVPYILPAAGTDPVRLISSNKAVCDESLICRHRL